MKIDLAHINNVVNGELIGSEDIEISQIAIDSRTVISGHNVLFFCIRGERHDGHHYMSDVTEKGGSCFVVDRKYQINENKNLNYIVVENTLSALHALAAWRRSQFLHPVISITGSNGKTIVKEWLAQCLQSTYKLVRSPKSYNSQVGVPLSLWLLDETSDLAIIEAGISKPGEMARLEQMIKPTMGIITNIGEAHQENFSSYEQKTTEKINLFKHCDIIIYNGDYELIDQLLKETYPGKKLISWSTKNQAWLQISDIRKDGGSTSIHFHRNNFDAIVSIPFVDAASIENAMHVLTFMLYLNIDLSHIRDLLQTLTPVAMRLEQKKGINDCVLINDTYNSDLHSFTIALDYLEQQPPHLHKSIVLSDILQSGRPEQELYLEVANHILNRKIHRFVGIGESLIKHRKLFSENKAMFYPSTEDFLKNFSLQEFHREAVLLKGARPFAFEKISSALEEKLHRTVFEINLDALIHNLNFYRSLVPSGTRMMVMLKAFSYGSGTFEVATVLQHHQVDYFGVAIADEGAELRRHGIHVPIIVMNPDDASFQLMTDHYLEPEIYSFQMLEMFLEHAKRNGLTGFPVHIKIDSGMHRLGFQKDEVKELVKTLQNQPAIRVKSVFSHLAASDEPENDSFTKQQVEVYQQSCKTIEKAFGHGFIRHMLNSAGIERFPQFSMDMVRLGIGLYGSSSHRQTNLQTVGTLKTTIIQIKTVPAGETIGYSRKGQFDEPKRIAVVPIGYADGLNRLLSNGNGYMMVNNRIAPIVGNICMDMCMMDVSEIDAKVNDEVIIFGEKPTIGEIAEKIGTIPYEVLTGISQRVKRIYYRT
jgi:alanine racemase